MTFQKLSEIHASRLEHTLKKFNLIKLSFGLNKPALRKQLHLVL